MALAACERNGAVGVPLTGHSVAAENCRPGRRCRCAYRAMSRVASTTSFSSPLFGIISILRFRLGAILGAPARLHSGAIIKSCVSHFAQYLTNLRLRWSGSVIFNFYRDDIGVCLLPEPSYNFEGINASPFPPGDFISNLMKLPVKAAKDCGDPCRRLPSKRC